MNELTPLAILTGDLESQSDDALRGLITKASKLLEDRKAQRQQQALAEIKRLAKENGLAVSVSKQTRKRGRPVIKDDPV